MLESAHPHLSRRERQIMDIIYARGEATAAEVGEALPNPPAYSTVRTLLRILEEKGHLKHREDGPRYVFLPTETREKASRSALKRVVQTFFDSSLAGAVAALVGGGRPAPAAPETPTQVPISAKFVEVRGGKWPESDAGAVNVKSAGQAAKLLRSMEGDKSTSIVAAASITTQSGQRGQIQIGEELKVDPADAKPTFADIAMDVVPTVAGGDIQPDVNTKITSVPPGGKATQERDAKASVSLAPGRTLIMAGGQGKTPDRQVVIFMETRVLAAAGAKTK